MNLREEDAGLAPLRPVSFFHLIGDCQRISGNELPEKHQKYLLPNTSVLCHEEHFADVAVGWNTEGIAVAVEVRQPVQQVLFPEISRGDSVELFIDTRDLKTSGFNTRFCHHFYFLPKEVGGHQAGELTHFRTEDAHPLCDPHALSVKCQQKKDRYILQIFISSQCLTGYDPEQFTRLGFTYRINRPDGEKQHFSAVTDEYKLEQQPSLWSSLQLIK